MDLRRVSRIPPVGAVMTPFPHSVDEKDSVDRVEQLMDEHRIRHIPVERGGVVSGIVSERELHQLIHRALPKSDKSKIPVRSILVSDPYVVDFSESLDQVLETMSKRRIGCAVVLRHDKLVGILSVTDVCQLLADLLRSYFASDDGNDAA